MEMIEIEEKENELIPVAMQIIIHAGNGRTKAQEALAAAKKNQFAEAQQLLKEAKDNITLAHHAQTEVIQNEARGISYEPCLLFTHAQDHLMTISSEVSLSKELVEFYELIMTQAHANES